MYSGTLLIRTDIDRARHSVLIKQVSILSGLIVEKIYEPFFVGPYWVGISKKKKNANLKNKFEKL